MSDPGLNASRRARASVWLRWIGLALVFVVLFGAGVVFVVVGEVELGGRREPMHVLLAVPLVGGWAALTVAFLKLMFPRRDLPEDIATGTAKASAEALALRARGTWTVWCMLVGAFLLAAALTVWLAAPVLEGRLALDTTVGGERRGIPAWLALVLGAGTTVACAYGAVHGWPLARRWRGVGADDRGRDRAVGEL